MKNNVDMSTGEGAIVDLMADVDFQLQGNDGDTADFVDVIKEAVLARCQDKAKLGVGKYNVRMLAVVTRNED